ncbi:hypothetical protein STANM309S_04201 [Streptomyces tanashiensis]
MRIFDPHIHMASRTTADYRAMYDAGVRALGEPSPARPAPHLARHFSSTDFDSLGWEPFRAAQHGIAHHCALALDPKEANDPRCGPGLDELPRYLAKDGVVAVGEIGYDSLTPAEDTALAAQLQLAADHGLPALVHTPHRDKLTGLRRTIDVVRESALPPDRVLLDHLNETTVKEAADSGAWLGFSGYPDTKMDEHRTVAILKEYGTGRIRRTRPRTGGEATPSRPGRSPTPCSPPASRTTTSTRSCGATPSPSTVSAGASTSTSPPHRTCTRATRSFAAGNEAPRMRFRHSDGSTVHLAYCTNVHPAETLDGVLAQLRDHCEPVRRRLGRDRLGIGLWLARDAAHSLTADPASLRALRAELDRRGLEVVTLNGFPYEGFGADEVKYRVYQPDWTHPERLAHTTDLARLLAALLPGDVTEGSVSTLPLGWRTPWTATAAATARTALSTLAVRLDALEELTGKSIRIGLNRNPAAPSRPSRTPSTP